MEIPDYATYDGATVMFEIMGFGIQPDSSAACCSTRACSASPGVRRSGSSRTGWASRSTNDRTLRTGARGRAFDIAARHVPKGGQAGLRFEIGGIVNGHPASSSSTSPACTRRCAPTGPSPPSPAAPTGSEITGEPSYALDICPTSRNGDHNHAAIVAAAGGSSNAIPAVVAARAREFRTTLDLPLITAKASTLGLAAHRVSPATPRMEQVLNFRALR